MLLYVCAACAACAACSGAAVRAAAAARKEKHAMRTHHRVQRERKQLGLAPLRKKRALKSVGMSAEEQAAQDKEFERRRAQTYAQA